MTITNNHKLNKNGYTPVPELLASNSSGSKAQELNAYSGLAKVTCELREDVAILRGIVTTFYLKQLVQELVKKVEGVERVVNQVDVSYLQSRQ